MQPVDAFLKDMAMMVRTLCAGAVPKSQKPATNKAASSERTSRSKAGAHP